MDKWVVLIVGILAVVAVVVYYLYKSDYAAYMTLQKAYDSRPVIWVYVDDSDVNARFWSDFGARSSRALNVPFLNLCYASIAKAAEPHYRVEMISGVADAVEKLGGAAHVPERFLGLSSKRALGPLEFSYLRVAFLERYGGLWMPLSTICLRSLPELPADDVVFFGSRTDELYTPALPGHHVVWAPKAGHPVMSEWADMLQRRVEESNGGSWVRGDDAQDMDALLRLYKGKSEGLQVMPAASLDRKANGKALGIEDWLARGDVPFMLTADALFMPVDYKELERREAYGWFLKMSEDQVMESDLAVAQILKGVI